MAGGLDVPGQIMITSCSRSTYHAEIQNFLSSIISEGHDAGLHLTKLVLGALRVARSCISQSTVSAELREEVTRVNYQYDKQKKELDSRHVSLNQAAKRILELEMSLKEALKSVASTEDVRLTYQCEQADLFSAPEQELETGVSRTSAPELVLSEVLQSACESYDEFNIQKSEPDTRQYGGGSVSVDFVCQDADVICLL